MGFLNVTKPCSRFFMYFGSKCFLAKHYPRPRYGKIIEPFAGSAGYSTLYCGCEVLLCDKYPVVADLWKWLIRADREEILQLPAKVMKLSDHPELGENARNLIVQRGDLDQFRHPGMRRTNVGGRRHSLAFSDRDLMRAYRLWAGDREITDACPLADLVRLRDVLGKVIGRDVSMLCLHWLRDEAVAMRKSKYAVRKPRTGEFEPRRLGVHERESES